MKKALRIISFTAGLISAASTVILAFVYFEDTLAWIKKVTGLCDGMIMKIVSKAVSMAKDLIAKATNGEEIVDAPVNQ